ncbi:MAG: hypothetical protein RXQ22_07850 [Sulfolobus sp.]
MNEYTLANKSKLNCKYFLLNVNKIRGASFYKKSVTVTVKGTLKVIEKGKINKTSRRD